MALVNTLFTENVIGYARNDGNVTIIPKLPKHRRAATIMVKNPQFREEVEIRINAAGDITTALKTIP